MKHINNTSSNTNSQQIVRQITLAVSVALSALALTACSSSKSNDSSSADSGNSQGSTQGSTQGNTQNTSSPINDTYYNISDYNFNDPDVSKRYIDVRKIIIDNGKVTQSTTYPAMGTHQPNSNSGTSNHVILAENFSFKGTGFDLDDLMDTSISTVRFYPDKIEHVLIDSSNNNTLTVNITGKQIDLSGQKVYDQNSDIETALNDRNGSVSEVYPKDAGCWAFDVEGLFTGIFKASKPYWDFKPSYPSSYATFSDWQNEVKKDISQEADSYIDGAFTDIKVGSNNEYNAQMVKVKTNDTKNGMKMTTYQGAVEYEGKIYKVYTLPHPDATIEIDPNSPDADGKMCLLYNEVAKDYIISQLKSLP